MKKIQTGDIITAQIKSIPFLFHKGIALVEGDEIWVYHNTPMYENEFGGSVVKESFADFSKSRKFFNIEKTNLTADEIIGKTKKFEQKKFDTLNFNCEHYVYFLVKGKKESPQLQVFVFLIAFLILIFLYENQNKENTESI